MDGAFTGASRWLRTMMLMAMVLFAGVPMAQEQGGQIAIDLHFLTRIKQDQSWLEQELQARGLHSGWQIGKGTLTTSDVNVAKYVHRINAFALIDQPLTYPWYVLELTDQTGRSQTCVLTHPRDILPNLSVLDFRQDTHQVPDLSDPKFAACKADRNAATEFRDMDRAAFRQRFFGQFGELNMASYAKLSKDPNFIVKAYDLGFYPFQGEFSGYLQISPV